MKPTFFFLITLFLSLSFFGQSPRRTVKKLGDHPVFYIDSINVDHSEIMKYDPNDVSVVNVLNGKEAIEKEGEDGKDGVVYIYTKKYAREKYWIYFKSKSPEYGLLVPTAESDSTVQYILNKRILKDNFSGLLFAVNDKVFKEIKLIDKETLARDYKITDKEMGVIIKSDIPANLYKGKKKF